jgi:hypothetical protein
VRDGSCTGAEIACNNDTANSLQSEVVRSFTANQHVVVIIDGNAGGQGTAVFNAQRITCPSTDLTGQTFPLALSTVGGTNTHDGVCGGAGQLERTYRWIPAQAGLYSITATSTVFAPSLYVEDGPRCGGTLLGCNRGGTYPAQVIRKLAAGGPVTLTVDGGSGAFTLNILRIDDGSTCGTQPIPFNTMVSIPSRGTNQSTATCSVAGSVDSLQSGPFPFADVTYTLTSSQSGSGHCTYTVTADAQINVYLISGACSGPEKTCMQSTTDAGGAFVASFDLGPADNGTYTLVIEDASTDASLSSVTFSISRMCAI